MVMNKKIRITKTLAILLTLTASLWGCIKPDNFPDEPKITDVSINKTAIESLRPSRPRCPRTRGTAPRRC